MDIELRKVLKGLVGIVLCRAGETPGGNRAAKQPERFVMRIEPVRKQILIQSSQRQSLGATRTANQRAYIVGMQTIVLNMTISARACVNSEVRLGGRQDQLPNVSTG